MPWLASTMEVTLESSVHRLIGERRREYDLGANLVKSRIPKIKLFFGGIEEDLGPAVFGGDHCPQSMTVPFGCFYAKLNPEPLSGGIVSYRAAFYSLE